MDTKRWSTLGVFVGGCLTGAVLIALHSAGVRVQVSSNHADMRDVRELAPPTPLADPPGAHVAPPPPAPPAHAANVVVAAPQAEPVEAGNSVADVLARLEAEYRKQAEAARAPAPAEPAREAAVEAPLPVAKESASERREVAAAPLPPAPVPVPVSAPTPSAEEKPVATAAAPVERVVYVREVRQEPPSVAPTQQVAALQQNMVVQQAAVAQQAALIQYYQLLALPGAVPVEPHPRKETWQTRGRISSVTPSSISATANPWGFVYKPTELVR